MKLALIQPDQLQPWEKGEIDRITGLLHRADEALGFDVVDRAADADLVVLLESCSFKTRHDLPNYRSLLRMHGADRLLCINYEDGPPGFLPGLYSSLESFRYEPTLHRSWPHLRLPNPLVDGDVAAAALGDQTWLFSFAGACSHPLRRTLFDAWEHRPGLHRVREIRRWYNHDDSEKLAFVLDIARSLFVLCPRGIASYSHRILETMALGRVPVVIADDWVPFSIGANDYYLHVPEADIGRLDEILEDARPRHAALSERVRAVYAENFSPLRRYPVALRELIDLHRQGAHMDAAKLEARWRSGAFWRANGWALDQRLVRRVGRGLQRLRQRLA